MSGSTKQPWGRTGRVALIRSSLETHNNILVDGGDAGIADQQRIGSGPWAAAVATRGRVGGYQRIDLPTLDAAVMWVLRRANPEVWRAERPVVARVRRARYLGLNEWWGEVPATNPRIRYIGARHEYQRVLRWADAEARLYASEGP